jgi:hypothetical protein
MVESAMLRLAALNSMTVCYRDIAYSSKSGLRRWPDSSPKVKSRAKKSPA